jgi:hypothetical protein
VAVCNDVVPPAAGGALARAGATAAVAAGQLALEAELHIAQVALVRPGVAVQSLGVRALLSGVDALAPATPPGRREQREGVPVLRVQHCRLREDGAAGVRVEAMALAAAIDEGGGGSGAPSSKAMAQMLHCRPAAILCSRESLRGCPAGCAKWSPMISGRL